MSRRQAYLGVRKLLRVEISRVKIDEISSPKFGVSQGLSGFCGFSEFC